MGRVWTFAASALVLCAESALAEGPHGFISSDRWAVLAPLAGLDCTAGDTRSMLENWVGRYRLAAENPVIDTEWEFLGPRVWRGNDPAVFEKIPPGPDPGLVDIGSYLSAKELNKDFTLAVAATYVSNDTGGPLPVGLCTSSDDSIQVWINDAVVLNLSVCRSVGPGCAEVTPAILAPGVNRLLVLLWNGVGDFGLHLGLARPDGTLYGGDGPDVKFLGADGPQEPVDILPLIRRSYNGEEFSRPDASHEVSIHGEGFGVEESTRVVEELRGPILARDITNVSDGGVVDTIDATGGPVGGFHVTVVGTPCSNCNWTNFDGKTNEFTSHATTGSDVWTRGDAFEFAFKFIPGDFEVAIEVFQKESWDGVWSRFGLMARQSLDYSSKFVAIEDHSRRLDGSRPHAWCTRRLIHHNTGSIDCDPKATPVKDASGALLEHPRFLRITRRDGWITTWVSNDEGCIGKEPGLDACWTEVCTDDWSRGPREIFVGFFCSTSESSGCVGEEIRWRLVSIQSGDDAGIPPAGARITWDVQGSVLECPGLKYTLAALPGSIVRASGFAGSSRIQGPEQFTFQAPPGPPVGPFETSHDIGESGPCSPGSLEVVPGGEVAKDAGGDAFRLRVFGGDISSGADLLHFAYSRVHGDFDARARFTDIFASALSPVPGKLGLMARWDARPDAANFFVFDTASVNECNTQGPGTSVRPRGDVHDGTIYPAQIWWQDVFGAERLADHCGDIPTDGRQGGLRGDRRNIALYLRLVRRGSTFYGYASADGAEWRTLGSFSWPNAPCAMLIGVAAASRFDCEPMDVVFDEFSIGPPAPIEPSAIDDDLFDQAPVEEMDDFSKAAPGECPPGWICSRWGNGEFSAQVTENRRLRLGDMQGSALGSGGDVATTAFLDRVFPADGSYLLDFDAFFAFDPKLAGDGPSPADGLTVCVLGTLTGTEHLDLRLGDHGGGLGYGRIQLSQDETQGRSRDFSVGSFAVEIDCRHNDEALGDGDGSSAYGTDPAEGGHGQGTAAYHVGLDVNGSVASVQRNLHLGVPDDALPDIYEPKGAHVRVLYDRGLVKAWVSPEGSWDSEPLKVLDHEIEPLHLTAPCVLIGFTAATGDSTCVMEVDDVIVRNVGLRAPVFHRGDAEGNGKLELTDAVRILKFLFLDPDPLPCMDAADADDNGVLEITDAVRILGYLFLGSPPPAPPGPAPEPCGEDDALAGVSLGCTRYSFCRGD